MTIQYRPYALTSRLHNNDAMLGVKTCRAARTCCAGRAHWQSAASQSVRGPGPAPGGMACRGWPSGCMLGDSARGSASFDPQRAGAPFCDVICIWSIISDNGSKIECLNFVESWVPFAQCYMLNSYCTRDDMVIAQMNEFTRRRKRKQSWQGESQAASRLLPTILLQAACWKWKVQWPLLFDHGKRSYVKLLMTNVQVVTRHTVRIATCLKLWPKL